MRLLLTRPEEDSARTAEILVGLGHSLAQAPMLRLEKRAPPRIDFAPMAIAFTSRNAVRAVRDWPLAAAWKDLPVFAVGGASAEAARVAGFSNVRSAQGTGKELAALMSATLARQGVLLYPTAPERSDEFEREMGKAGFELVAVEAYRMAEARALPSEITSGLRAGKIDGVLLYSERTAKVFVKLLRQEGCAASCRGVVFFVLARRIADVLAPLEGAKILIAAKPDEEQLIHLIAEHWRGR